MDVDQTVIDMLDRFGAHKHFQIAKNSSIVCIDQIIETIFEFGTKDQVKKMKHKMIAWNLVKLGVWDMTVTEYAKIKEIDY